MEKNNKNLFSFLLMSVGVIFIVVAGGIFVSRTWQYIPSELKQCILVLVTAGLYAGSYAVAKKMGLKLTEAALYYLAVFFTGFTSLSILMKTDVPAMLQWTLVQVIMLLPLTIHYVRKHSILDYLLQILLTNGALFTLTCFSAVSEYVYIILTQSVMLLLTSMALRYTQNEIYDENKYPALMVLSVITYCIHAFLFMIFIPFVAIYQQVHITLFALLMFAASVTVIYFTWENTYSRVLQSLVLCICIFTGSMSMFVHLLTREMKLENPLLFLFIPFVTILVLWVILRRTELYLINMIFTVIYSLLSIVLIMINMSECICVYPFALITAATCIIIYFLTGKENRNPHLPRLAFMFAAISANQMLAELTDFYAKHYSLGLLVALVFLAGCVYTQKETDLRSVLCTLSLCNAAFAFIKTVPFTEKGEKFAFHFEYVWCIIALTIVLTTFIWYHKKESFQRLQFIPVSLLILMLLGYNFVIQQLPHVMFFAIVTLSVFLLSTLKKNRICAIVSAISLILVVIYLTKAVWMSIAWWVYLFIAGVALVIFAIKREKAEEK